MPCAITPPGTADVVMPLVSSLARCQSVCAGYTESSVDQLTTALCDSLVSYNPQSKLVFFREAVQHAARLSRVLVTVAIYELYNE